MPALVDSAGEARVANVTARQRRRGRQCGRIPTQLTVVSRQPEIVGEKKLQFKANE